MTTQDRLKELFDYDPATGKFTRVVSVRGARKTVGAARPDGYLTMCVDSKGYLYHRLVWLWCTGVEPPVQIDHVNGDRSDNRISNLRLATHKQNQENKHRVRTRTGFRGVTLDVRTGRFIARIGVSRRTFHIGVFDTVEEAATAAKTARDQLFTHHTS
jgi:hypothetical protein